MRTVGAAALFLCISAVVQQPAIGQETCGPDKLGVARTVVIDASKGPHFGSQYKSNRNLLADGEVVLTFDDGPSRTNTPSILETLAAQCTKATFFMVGRMALSHPEMVKEVARRGHTVATHTWSHANLQRVAEGKAEAEIELGFSAVRQALGKPISPFFRFPYLRTTAFSLEHLHKRQIATFAIDVDSRDFQIRSASALYERVIREVAARRKGIILFHDIHASTAHALPRVLAELKKRGFRIVHLKAKAGAETVVQYDTLAQKEADRRRVAATRNPLVKRTVVWPATGLAEANAHAKAPRPPTPTSAPARAEEDWTAKLWRPN